MGENAERENDLDAFAQASVSRGLLDLATSVVPYLALTAYMYATSGDSIFLTLGLAIPAAGFLLRTFIVFHDCGHGSFMPDKRANRWIGRFTAHRYGHRDALEAARQRLEVGDVQAAAVDPPHAADRHRDPRRGP